MLVKRKISELRVSELKAELEKRKLDSKGLKSSLLQRLQKAVLDEGGDIDQIEVDVNVGSSPLGKKSSQRIKRLTDPVVEVEGLSIKKSPGDDNDTATSASDEEKSAHTNDGNLKETEAVVFDYDKSEVKEKEIEDEYSEEVEEINKDDGNLGYSNEVNKLMVQDETVDIDQAQHVAVDDGALKKVRNPENAEVASCVVNVDNVTNVDESERSVQTANHGDDIFVENHLRNDDETIVFGDNEKIKHEVKPNDLVDVPSDDQRASEHEQPVDVTVKSSDDEVINDIEVDKQNDHAEMKKPDDVALEDDVLDMLDYDIEIPENAQAEHSNEDDNEDAQVAKTSDESCNKDTSNASERVREASDEEKGLKNLWITGLSASTRASELKIAFSRYGKVVGAKVVTNARSPGAKCYGFVAMATSDAAKKCLIHLHKTDLHGRLITVEYTKNDPSAKRTTRDTAAESDEKASQPSDNSPATTSSRQRTEDVLKEPTDHDSQARRTTSDLKSKVRSPNSSRVAEKRVRKSPSSRVRDGARTLRRASDGKREIGEPYRKRARPIGERRVMFDNERGGLSLRVNVRSAQDGRNAVRRTSPHRLTRPDERTTRRDGRSIAQGAARARNRDAREREIRSRDAREEISRRRATNKRPTKSMALQASIERDRIMLQKEKEERNFLRMEREKLEKERRQLERDRIERSRLEQERIKLEHERKLELEKIEREKEEMKRLQEINRFEQSQRQRALKRMYDGRDEGGANVKRGDRDDRRRFEGETRERHAAPLFSYQDEEGDYRRRAAASGRMEKVNYHDVDRRNMTHNDTDARYSSGRRVEKYERSKDYDRRGADNSSGNSSYRHHDKSVNDDRKVVPRDRSRLASSTYRRDESSMTKKELTMRGSGGSSRMRAGDRDLREEIRQAPMSGSTRKGSPHLADVRLRDEPSLSRSAPRGTSDASKYHERGHPEAPMHINTSIPSAPAGGKPIPTTGRSGLAFQPSSSWPAWPHPEREETSAVWHGPGSMPGGGASVGRLMAPMGMPFSHSMSSVSPSVPLGADPGLMGHGMSDTFVQSRMDGNFKPVRRF